MGSGWLIAGLVVCGLVIPLVDVPNPESEPNNTAATAMTSRASCSAARLE
jgi:hypothetical protein